MSEDTSKEPALEVETLRLRQEVVELKSALDAERRRLADQEIRRSEALYRAVYDEAQHLTGILDLDGVLRHANRTAREFIGKDPVQFIGKPFWETPWWTHSAEEQERLRDAIRRAAQGGSVQFETTHRTAGGHLRNMDFTLKPARDEAGQVFCLVAEGWDITERKRAEEVLRESEDRFRSMIEQSPFSIQVYSPRGDILEVNPACEQLWGVKKDNLGGYNLLEDRQVEALGFMPLLRRAFAGERVTTPVVEYDASATLGAGNRIIVQGNLYPIRDAHGAIRYIILVHQDITERMRAEEALQRERAFVEAVFDSVPGLLYLYDDQGRLVRWNKQHETLTGYSAEELGQMHLMDWYRGEPEEAARIAAAVQKIAAQGHAEAEAGLVIKNGKRIPFYFTAVGIQIDGRDYFVGIGIDVTERRRVADALRKSQASLEAAQAQARIGNWELDLTTGTGSWSKQMFHLLGLDPEQGVPTLSQFLERVHPDDRMRLLQNQDAAIASGKPNSSEFRSNPAWGPIRHFHNNIQIVRPSLGRSAYLVGTLQDITERKQAEASLRESEERFKRLLQNSNDIIAVMDAECILISVSGPLEARAGYTVEELIGRNALDLIHPDDLDSVKKVLAEILAQPGSTRRVEYRNRRKNGSWVTLETVGTNLLQDPAVRGIVLNVRDISERKTAEQEKSRLQDQLQQAMKMEAVGRLAGGIAHDFNNLLTAIAGNVELARLGLRPSDPLHHYLEGASKAAESAAALTRQLLAFSRRQIIEPKVLSLNELVANLQHMLGRLIGEDIALHAILADDLGSVRVDPGQFEQVLVNLAVNARDAMPDGGRLLIETANRDLDAQYCANHPQVQPGRFVLLAVSDTGHGMSPEVKRRIFEPFFTTKPIGRGTGLGLATIFGIVSQAGGTIEVYSEEGLGTTLKIYLPRIEQPAESLAQEVPTKDLARGSETVLLVEDEASVRDVAPIILKHLGYDVLAASNAGEALLLAEKHPGRIDLLMTDVVMPGMNGRELAERLNRVRPEMKVLFASGYTENVIVHHGILEQDLHFIGKPYSLQALAKKIRKVLDPDRK